MNPITEYVYLAHTAVNKHQINEYMVYELCPVYASPGSFFHRYDMMGVFIREVGPSDDWFEKWKEWLLTTPEGAADPDRKYNKEEVSAMIDKGRSVVAQFNDLGTYTVQTVAPRMEVMYGLVKFPKYMDNGAVTKQEMAEHSKSFVAAMREVGVEQGKPNLAQAKKPCGSCGGGKVR